MNFQPFPVLVLCGILILIAIRQVGRFRLRIWQIMAGGAVVLLVTGQIGPREAVQSVNMPVMVFLFSMFVLGEALLRSGSLSSVSSFFFGRARTGGELVLLVLGWCGIISAFLLNDTVAIIATPLMVLIAKVQKIEPSLLLIALAFAVTTGCLFTPVGSPQALLIAVDGGITAPFLTFLVYLGPPAFFGLVLAYAALRLRYPGEMKKPLERGPVPGPLDPSLTTLVTVSLFLLALLLGIRACIAPFYPDFLPPLYLVGLVSVLPVLGFSSRRGEILKAIDWPTLVFFLAMFVVMAAVWSSGFFTSFLPVSDTSSVPFVLLSSLFISQFISNVPCVALMMPFLSQGSSSVPLMMALAAGSTLAGNMTVTGAASNVIIVQNAEKDGVNLSFFEFFTVGLPLCLAQVAVCWGWFSFLNYFGV